MKRLISALALCAALAGPALAVGPGLATGGLGVVVERATGSLLVVDRIGLTVQTRIEGLGDLSHASVNFSPDERFAYVFGRDGGLTRVDLIAGRIDKRIIQGGNSIGGAISDDGALVAVSNYEPGGIRIFDAATLEMVADIPSPGKTVGLVELPGRRFAWAVWDSGEAWMADLSGPSPVVTRLGDTGANPYDAVLSADGRHFVVGLFGAGVPAGSGLAGAGAGAGLSGGNIVRFLARGAPPRLYPRRVRPLSLARSRPPDRR